MVLYIIIKSIILIIFYQLYKYTCRRKSNHPNYYFKHKKPIIEAHRGINRELFQNTLPSIALALENNIKSIEIDVWLSKDLIPVLHHGNLIGSLRGYYNTIASVTTLTWDELSKLKSIRQNLHIARLDEVLELLKGKSLLNLEIKDPRINLMFPIIMEYIEKYDYFDQIVISSFYHKYYNKILRFNRINKKNLNFGFLYLENYSSPYDYNHPGNGLNIYWTNATKKVCDRAHKNGMYVLVWFYMYENENETVYRRLIENGVDVICSNEPAKAKKYVNYYYYRYG